MNSETSRTALPQAVYGGVNAVTLRIQPVAHFHLEHIVWPEAEQFLRIEIRIKAGQVRFAPTRARGPGVKAAGVLQKALDALPGLAVTVFDQTPSNPTEAAVRARPQRCTGRPVATA